MMRDHFIEQTEALGPSALFVTKRKNPSLTDVEDRLFAPETKRRRTLQNHVSDTMDICDVNLGDEHDSGEVCFKVILTNLSKKTCIPVSIGLGGQIEQNDYVITTHEVIRGDDASLLVKADPQHVGAFRNSARVADILHGDIVEIAEGATHWKHCERQWTLSHYARVGGA